MSNLQQCDDDFQSLADALAGVSTSSKPEPVLLAQELDVRLDGLKQLLDQPQKNECSREKLNKGKIELDGVVYEVNQVFIQKATQIADDLDLDELYAAKLLIRSQNEKEKLNRTELQTAFILYHTRRKNTLDCARLLLNLTLSEDTSTEWKSVLVPLAEKLVTGPRSFAEKCIAAMGSTRQAAQKLKDKERQFQTLRLEPPPGFKEDLDLQLKFLRNQHEVLACIVYYLIRSKKANVADFRNLLDVVRQFDKYDAFTAHHTLPLFAFVPFLCSADQRMSFEEIIQLHKELLKAYKESPWQLRYLQAALEIWWLSEFNGLCNDPPSADAPSLPTLEYSVDILLPSKAALKDGGVEFLMAMAFDINTKCSLNAAKEELHRFLQSRVPPCEEAAALLNDFRQCMFTQFELFIDSHLANMADLLKMIKTEEEEDQLLDQRCSGFELERFYLLIHYVYAGRLDAGLAFWDDTESNLHGFLMWACNRQTPFMAATLSYALASLANGEECALGAHRFLKAESPLTPNKVRRSVTLSYSHIFAHIQSYKKTLEGGNQALVPVNSYKARIMSPPRDALDPSPEASMMLDAYLRLIGQIASECAEAREFLVIDSESHMVISLFDLLHKQIPTQLWDSIFYALSSVLIEKHESLNTIVWSKLDDWALKPRMPSSALALHAAMQVTGPSPDDIFDQILVSVHPAVAWVRLLTTLVRPITDGPGLDDALPFPENLGSSNRISGLDPYIDHVLGKIFSNTTIKNLPPELAPPPEKNETIVDKLMRAHYKAYRHALQLSCLDFIHVCLKTFNEDLFVLASKNIPVEPGMRTRSLDMYAKMHPFGRVLEHLLTEKCFNVFNEILHMGVQELLTDAGEPRESSVQVVFITIEILDLALQMQSTFLQVVRPLMKQEDGLRRTPIGGNGFPSIEEAILFHLDIVVDLGLYVGAAQYDVVLTALGLLEKLSIAPNIISFGSSLRNAPKDRLLEMVEQSSDSRRIVFNFIHQWEADFGDVKGRFDVKLCILRFLSNSLSIRANEYTLAHVLLGFGYDPKEGIALSIAAGGIGTGISLFHRILDTGQDVPEVDQLGSFNRDLCCLKKTCFAMLGRLWKSPTTSSETLYLLRANKFFFEGFIRESVIQRTTTWQGTLFDTQEFFNEGSIVFRDFLQRRTLFWDYAALEIRHLTVQGASTTVSSYLSTLLGTTLTAEGPVENPDLLALLDFLEVDLPEGLHPPKITSLKDIDISAFRTKDLTGVLLYDIHCIDELCLLKENERRKNSQLSQDDAALLTRERATLLNFLSAENQLRLCQAARLECLATWTALCELVLGDCEFEGNSKIPFILQALQTILPKLEQYSKTYMEGAEILSHLAVGLVSHLPSEIAKSGDGRSSDVAGDRLFQLFRASLRCVQSPLSTAKLREDFYIIALRYFTGISDFIAQGTAIRINAHTIKSSGERLLDVICNDAYAGEGECKVVALLMLENLAALANAEGSKYVLDSLVRQNFIVVLVDSIKHIGRDLRHASREGAELVIKSFRAAASFLVRIAETREGAGLIIDSGFFQALQNCELLSVDPDLGLGFDDPQSLNKYYGLLHDVVRVVTAVELSLGPQNRQAIELGRRFLSENRVIAITVFKRQANIGGQRMDSVGNLSHLVDCFVLLSSFTGFIEAEEERINSSIAPKAT